MVQKAISNTMTPYLWFEYWLTLLFVPTFTHDCLEHITRQFCQTYQLSLKELAAPIRLALTGSKNSPPLFHIMEILGPQECVQRLDKFFQYVTQLNKTNG